MYINRLFEKEDKIRQKYKTFDAIKEARLTHEKPIIEGFLSWLESRPRSAAHVWNSSGLYIGIEKNIFMTYLEDDDAVFEQFERNSNRPFVVGEKGGFL